MGGTLRNLGFTWLSDLIYKYQNIPQAIAGWFLIPTLLFGFLYIFLNGGIMAGSPQKGKRSPSKTSSATAADISGVFSGFSF